MRDTHLRPAGRSAVYGDGGVGRRCGDEYLLLASPPTAKLQECVHAWVKKHEGESEIEESHKK